MDSTKTSPKEWALWLERERHISDAVFKEADLMIHRGELAIPVRDIEGKLLFYKYRRSFKSEEGPKYRYDSGATAALYGAETLKNLKPGEIVVITEGELDALAIRSLDHHAVSSTGGAGTWREEWSALLAGFSVVILYDADGAGVEGALLVASKLPGAKVAWLPVLYGKDPTEIIHAKRTAELAMAVLDAREYHVPHRESMGRLGALKRLQKVLVEEHNKEMADPEGTPFHVDFAQAWVEREIAAEKKAVRRIKRQGASGSMAEDIARARARAIPDLIKVNRQRKALCLWHTDKTPSLHVYADHAFCFVCGKRADAIDVYQELNHCDFKTAVAALA